MYGLMKDEYGEKIMTKFVGLRAKIYSYLTDSGSEDKKAKQNLTLKIIKAVWKQLNLGIK